MIRPPPVELLYPSCSLWGSSVPQYRELSNLLVRALGMTKTAIYSQPVALKGHDQSSSLRWTGQRTGKSHKWESNESPQHSIRDSSHSACSGWLMLWGRGQSASDSRGFRSSLGIIPCQLPCLPSRHQQLCSFLYFLMHDRKAGRGCWPHWGGTSLDQRSLENGLLPALQQPPEQGRGEGILQTMLLRLEKWSIFSTTHFVNLLDF